MREELTKAVPKRPPKRWGADLMQIAARASWVAPVIAFVVGMSVRSTGAAAGGVWLATRVICGMVMLAGLGSASVAWVGIRRRGPEELIVPASVGLIVTGAVAGAWLLIAALGK